MRAIDCATRLYDALGRRVEAITPNGGFAGATQVHYWYDTAGHLRTMWDQHGNWLTDHFYLGGQYLGSYSTFWTFKDLLGSARILTNPDKSVKDSIDYLPYGEQQSGSYWTNLKFTGNEHDIESGLEHTQFRQYSSSTGAWMHPDPAGLAAVDPSNPQSWNRYTYVISNPLAWTDPFGLDPCPNDNSWGAQLCKQAQAFRSTTFYNTWNPFSLFFKTVCGESGCVTSINPNLLGLLNTSGIRAPGQTYQQCLAANAHTYSAGGAAELAVNVATGTNTDITSNPAVDFFTGNSVNSFLFGNATDAGLAAAGQAPGALEAGVGKGLTYGRRTSGSIALNLAGKGGLPQALSSSTGGLRSVLGSVGNALNLGLKASTRLGIDLGLTGAEAIGCAIPRS